MASVTSKIYIQLSILLVSYCFSAFGSHISLPPHSDFYYPTPPSASIMPFDPPSESPMYPPTDAPVNPPVDPRVIPPVSPPLQPPMSTPEYPPMQPPVNSPMSAPVQPPVSPPVYSPVQPPVSPPEQPPVSPPPRPPPNPLLSRFVAVQGVVYCKSCKYDKVDTLLEATPIPGAIVRLTCENNPIKPVVQEAETDKNGYFFLQAPNTVTVYAVNKCTMTLVSSPKANCSEPTDLNGGLKGARLRLEMPFMAKKLPFILLSVGPFAFAPKC